MPDKNMEEAFTRADRDTIIRLDTKFDILISDVKDLKNNLVNRVDSLEATRVNKQDLDLIKQKASDLELRKVNHTDIVALDGRVASLENYQAWIKGGIALIGVVVALVIYIYFVNQDTLNKNILKVESELEKHVENK